MYKKAMRRMSMGRLVRRIAMFVALACVSLTLPGVADAQAPIPVLAGMSASASSLRDSIASLARAQIGTRYRHGGASPVT